MPYIVGNTALIRAKFVRWDEDTETYIAADPTTAIVVVEDPTGSEIPLTLVSTGVIGTWSVEVPITMEGKWRYEVSGSGALTAIKDGSFEARESRV